MLTSREYKVILNAEPFAVPTLDPVIAAFLADQLRPAVERHLGTKAADEMAKKGFELQKRRSVRFLDTPDGALSRAGVIARLRRDAEKEASSWELTVKLRSPDLLAVLDAAAEEIEEDIVPLVARDGEEGVLLNAPRSMRSLFAQAVKVEGLSDEELPATVAAIVDLGGSLGPGFALAMRRIASDAVLTQSVEVAERVFRRSGIDIEDGMKLRFDLTSWQRPDHAAPLIELSYRMAFTDDHKPAPGAVRQAMALFLTIQDLPWADPRGDTKSSFAFG